MNEPSKTRCGRGIAGLIRPVLSIFHGTIKAGRIVTTTGMLAFVLSGANADRNILGPRGGIALPDSGKLEFITTGSSERGNTTWLTLGSFVADLPLELEVERTDFGSRRNTTFSLQYMVTTEAFIDVAPAISVGVRDLPNRGREGRAFFVAASKSIGLSRNQGHLTREFELHLGIGSSHMDGLYGGAEAHLAIGCTVRVEYLSQRFNTELAIPLTHTINLKAYTLNGDVFYGASLLVVK